MSFFGFDEDMPIGVDLRLFIFDGLPAGAFEAWADDEIAAFGAAGFGAEEKVKPPPAPNVKDPGSIRAYLAETWRVMAVARKAWNTDAQEIYARINGLPVAKSPQTMIADIITAGPLPTHALASKFYAATQNLQALVQSKTKENPIAATAGLMAAEVAKAVATQLKAAKDTVKRTVNAPLNVIRDVTAAADAAHARSVDAAKSVLTMPGQMVRDVTSVPSNLVNQVAATADKYIDTARELAPQLAPYLADTAKGVTGNLADVAGKISFGVGAVIVGTAALGAAGLAAYYAGPALLAASAAKGRK